MSETYQPPFQYFGGKSAVADAVWAAFGADIDNYVEPFFGSGAVLFLRPGGAGQTETVNDADGFEANFWRAVQHDPDAVAEHADNPVNEADLHARHLWLIGQRERITERLMGDPDYFDVKAAGWWCWGLSCWIGSGWCSGNGPWVVGDDGSMVKRGSDGRGVNRKLPHLGDDGMGVNRNCPHLGDDGRGVNRKLPHLGDDGRGARAEYRDHLVRYINGLADRLRRVRVCCGDWSRICGSTPTVKMGMTGVFLDPPYADTAGRCEDIYANDSVTVAHDVREWAIANGHNPLMRIALCGYDGEHVMPDDWRVLEWKAAGGYGSQGDTTGRVNAHRERIWFSPGCLNGEPDHLFSEVQP